MITYYFLGNYTSKSLNSVSATRTNECAKLIENYDGEIILMHALIGQYDLALIINFPNNEAAMKASIALTKTTGIRFESFPAVAVSHFDEMVNEIYN